MLTAWLLQTRVPTMGSYFFDEVPVNFSNRMSCICTLDYTYFTLILLKPSGVEKAYWELGAKGQVLLSIAAGQLNNI